MLQKITQSFSELKNSISLKYIDTNLRDKCNQTLQLIKQTIRIDIFYTAQTQICKAYILKIQQQHQTFLQSISTFIDSFPHYASQCQQNLQSMQQEILSTNKTYEQEKKQWQLIMQEMNQKMEITHRQILTKQQEIRWLQVKLEERDVFIDQLERQSSQYLKKVQADLQKQQKALEESFYIVANLEQEIESLKYQNEKLLQDKKAQTLTNQPKSNIISIAQLQINKSFSNSPKSSCSFANCSLISSNSHHGLSQFQQLHHQYSRQNLDSLQFTNQLPTKCQTLKQMLNMSVQKQYKIQYNKCDSIQQKLQQQNYKIDEGNKENNEGWISGNSLQFLSKERTRRIPIKQFNLANTKQDCKNNNPYYFYFIITSQNAKINSNHFEQISTLSTESQWQCLNNSKVPLHEWEDYLRKFLLKEAKIY